MAHSDAASDQLIQGFARATHGRRWCLFHALVFSYQRDDAIGSAGRVFDWLVHRFGRSNVFLDADKIASGEDFARVPEERLARSDVVLVLIGPRWLDTSNAAAWRPPQSCS